MFRKQFQKEIWGDASEELGLVLPLNLFWAFPYLLWRLGGSQTTSAPPCLPLGPSPALAPGCCHHSETTTEPALLLPLPAPPASPISLLPPPSLSCLSHLHPASPSSPCLVHLSPASLSPILPLPVPPAFLSTLLPLPSSFLPLWCPLLPKPVAKAALLGKGRILEPAVLTSGVSPVPAPSPLSSSKSRMASLPWCLPWCDPSPLQQHCQQQPRLSPVGAAV